MSQASTPQSSIHIDKQTAQTKGQGYQGSQKQLTANSLNDEKDNLIAKNSSMISDILLSERVSKTKDFFSPDNKKKIIQINTNLQNFPQHHFQQQGNGRKKLSSPAKTTESQSLSNLKVNLQFNNSQNQSVNNEAKFPHIIDNNQKITEQIALKKFQNAAYLFKDEEDQSYMTSGSQLTGNQGISNHSKKSSVHSFTSFQTNPSNKQRKQSPIKAQQRYQYSNGQSQSAQNSMVNIQLGQSQQQNIVDQLQNQNKQHNSQQSNKIFSQTQNNLYQLDKLMKNQLRDNYGSLDKAQLKNIESSSTKNSNNVNVKAFRKSNNYDASFSGQNSTKNKQLSSAQSARDISYMKESRKSIAKQTENRINTKTEQNLSFLITPKQNLSEKQAYFTSRKSSYSELKSVTSNQFGKSTTNGFTNTTSFVNTPVSSSKNLTFTAFRTQDFQNNTNEQAYNLIPHLPNNFIEEFLSIMSETNSNSDSFSNSQSSASTAQLLNKNNTFTNTQIIKSIHQEIQSILTNQTITPMQTQIPSSLVELVTSLKKQHPNLYTGQPSGRAEVQIVKNWLETTFNSTLTDPLMNLQEKFQKIDDSLILTFNELVRQVSYQCKERGMLLISVFSCYFSLIKKVSFFEQEEKRKVNLQNQYEKLLLQKNADDDIGNKNNQIAALNELLSIEQNKNAELKKELRIQVEKEKETISKNEKLKQLNDFAKVHLIKMKREIDDLRSRLQSKELFQQKKLEKFLLDYKTNLKKQTSSTYYSGRKEEKIEEQDQELIKNLLEIPKSRKLQQKATIDDIEEKLELSFSELIKEADQQTRHTQNEDVIIKQYQEDKDIALVSKDMQTDPMMSLTYTKSIKIQTDLDLVDSKYDQVFGCKQKVEDFLREQMIKINLFSLEETLDPLDTSIDQENGLQTQRNVEKPVLSKLFQGLPIKKLKQKISKNQLERFIENMGVLYSYIKEPDANFEKDKQENLKNMISQNIRKDEYQDMISMKEIKEVDEKHEGELKQVEVQRTKLRNNSQKSEFTTSNAKLGSQTNLPTAQSRTEIKRNNGRANTLSQLRKQNKMLEAMSLHEKNQLRDQIKQQFEMNFYQQQSNQQLIEQIQKQQKIIEQLSPYALGDADLDNSFTQSKKLNTSGSSPINKSIQAGKRASVSGSFQDQQQSPQNKVSFNVQSQSPIVTKNQTNQNNNSYGSSNLTVQGNFSSTFQGNQSSVNQGNSSNIQQQRKQSIQVMQPKGVSQKYINTYNQDQDGANSNTNQQSYAQNTSLSMYNKHDETNNSMISDQNIITPDLQMQTNFQDNEIKQQVISLLQLYNMEIEKNTNLRESLEELIKLLRELYSFLKLLFVHIKKTQKNTHKSIIEGFIQQFTSIKWKLPKEFDTNFDKEVLKEEKEDEKKKQFRLKFSNKKSTVRFLAHVQKNQAFTKMTQLDKNTHFGFILANRLRDSGIPKKYSTFLPLKNTLKYIQNLVDERVRMIREQRLPKDQDMPIFTYNKFLQIFGFKKVAENKYSQFLMSIVHYQSIFRVNVFAKLLTVLSEKKLNYTPDEMEKYFQAYEFIVNLSTMGVLNPSHSETDSTFMVPLLKALDYTKVILEKIMPFEDLVELRQQLDNMKEIDLKSANKIPVVDFDIFMSKVLSKYRLLMNKTQLFVKNAFFAADLDGNGRINLNEFLTLYRHIMSNKFNLMKCIKIFENKADIITDEEKNLSFDKFTAVCIDYNLFSTQMQDKYINVTNKDEIQQKIDEMKDNWTNVTSKVNEKIEILKPFVVPESYKNWMEILKVLEHRILDDIQEENYRPILIAHKLLNDELDRLIEEGKQGGENEGDDDQDDDDLFNLEDDDNDDLQTILKQISKNNQSQIYNGININILESQNKQFEEELSRNETQISNIRNPSKSK